MWRRAGLVLGFLFLGGLLAVGVQAVAADPADAGDPLVLFVSSDSPGSVDGISFQDEDILSWDSTSRNWSMVVDGSVIGLPASSDINGFHVVNPEAISATDVLLTFQGPTVVPGLGSVDDSDIVAFNTGSGLFSLVLDGSDVGLVGSSEDIDSIAMLGGDLVISLIGGGSVPAQGGGALSVRDEDLLVLDTAGSYFEILIDGSDIGLSGEDISGATIDETTDEIFIATFGGFSVPGLSGDKDDIPVFTGSTGDPTSGTLESFFNGDDHGFGTEQIDGVSLQFFSPPPPGTADLSITKVDDVDPVKLGETITYTVEITNNGPDPAENVVVSDILPAGTSLVATVGCVQDPNGLPCSLGTIDAGSAKSYTVAVLVDSAAPGVITNTAEVSSGTADTVPGNNTASEDTLVVIAPTAANDGPASNSAPGDAFHTAAGATIATPNLTDDDDLGDPAATITSFGGGDVGGAVTDNAAGVTVGAPGGDLLVNGDGTFQFAPSVGFSGLFEFDYRLTGLGGVSDATVTIYVGDRPATTSRDMVWVSSSTSGSTGGVSYADEDILAFDAETGTWTLHFDGSDVGLGATDINAFHIVDPADPLSPILISVQAPLSVAGLGTVDDADVISFAPTTLGASTAGSFTRIFDGSDNSLQSSAEDIDALALDESGNLLISTIGGSRVPTDGGGDLFARDEDLLLYDEATSTYSLFFDGGDVDLAAEDLVGASFDPLTSQLYGTALDGFVVSGAAGDKNDVFSFTGTLGDPTTGTFSTFFDGQDLNLSSEQIDGLHVSDLPDSTGPVANPDRAVTAKDAVLNVGPGITAMAAFGSEGTGIGRFSGPGAVAVLGPGEIVVVDTENHRIQICDLVGACISFGSEGSASGQFLAPAAVAVTAAGEIVVADTGNDRIQICDEAGSCSEFGVQGSELGEFFSPSGVAVTESGEIVVADTGNDRIQVCTDGSCTEFGESGSAVGQFFFPAGVTVDESGEIVVADNGNDRIQVCTTAGSCSELGSPGDAVGQFMVPTGVAVSGPGEIAVADANNDRLQICQIGGSCSVLGGFGSGLGQFSLPTDVATGSGHLVVADFDNSRVQVFSAGGVLGNDSDPFGGGLTITDFDELSIEGASVVVNGDGSYSYDPAGSATMQALSPGQSAEDTFTYTIADGNGADDVGTVTVVVTGQ